MGHPPKNIDPKKITDKKVIKTPSSTKSKDKKVKK